MIRILEKNEFRQAADLSLKVFTRCGAEDFNAEGLKTFNSFIYADELRNELTIYGAFESGKLIGALGVKNERKHISLFFISPEYHRKGIGSKLFDFAMQDQPMQELTVNSSSYAISFYQSIGFEKVCEKQETNGLKYTPMKRIQEQSQITPSAYYHAAEVIKTAILQGQYEVLKDENRVQLAVYFGVGKYVSINSRKDGTWGTGALEAISERLRKILPGLRGFSANSLKNMRKFYEQWSMLDDQSTITNVETGNSNSTIAIVELPDAIENIDIYHALAFPDTVLFPVEDFLHTPFTHHIRIIESVDDTNERYYYIRRCAKEHLSVEALKRLFKDDAFHNQQQIPNNFATAKISAKEARKAVMMFKDEYTLDFINVEEIGERDSEDIDERVVEQQIVQNIKRFIMTFGNDFAFIGNQYHLEVYGVEHFPDLLFFNRELNAMVCVELKVGAFKPSYLGQLTAYLRILDDHLKKSHENPSIGIVLCKSAKREYVEYIIQDYEKPMGVATYTTSADMPEDLRKALPDMDELKKLLIEQ